MATTVKLINELYQETIDKITKDTSTWLDFLNTASMNYTNSFSEQLLIYAQRKEAIACADINTWNGTYKRFVNTGCPGIGLLTEKNGRAYIEYVWGVNDTHSIYGRKGKKLKIWTVPKAYEEQVIESLENKFGTLEAKESLVEAIKSVAIHLTEDNYSDYFEELIENKENTRLESLSNEIIEKGYIEILKNSIAYMIINRSGITPTSYFNFTDFNNISMFQDIEMIGRLGTAISDISEMGLREIYLSLKNIRIAEIEKIRTFDKKDTLVYSNSEIKKKEERRDSNDLYREGRFYTTESSDQGRAGFNREIRNDETGVFKETQERNVSSNVDERNSSQSFERDRGNITETSRIDNKTNEIRPSTNGRDESKQSNEMGWSNEQHQESSRRNSEERTNLYLTEDEEERDTNNSVPISTQEKYDYKKGDKVFIGLDEYIIDKVGLFDIELYNPQMPLFGRTMNIVDFENKLMENPANDHLKTIDLEQDSEDDYYGEYNDEVDLIEHILSNYGIHDIDIDFNEDEVIVASDDENIWVGEEVYSFLFDELFEYNDDGKIAHVNKNDLIRLEEYRKKYQESKEEKVISKLAEKEKVPVQTNAREQLSLFASKEQELADKLVDEFNKLDTKYQGTFYVDSIELEKWDHTSSKKRNLTISIKSEKCTGYNETAFTQFNSDKTDEVVLRESVQTNPLLKYLSKDSDFSITIAPDSLYVFYLNFDKKVLDLSVANEEVLSSINDEENVEVIDNPKPKEQKKVRKNKVINYVLHPEVPYEERINYRIHDDYLGAGTPKERYQNNIEAIKILKKCESEDRYATKEEQEILARYVGWGGLSQAFNKNGDWLKEYNELKELLTDEEFNNAMDSTLTAFYTPPVIIKSMYKALENMGLKKGNILEPSCGIGNFIGMLPNNDKLKIYGVEKDDLSGRIAKQLYQRSSIAIQGFEDTDFSNSFFDVVVGNVPFGDFPIFDKKYNQYHFLIHDYFFAKTIDKVRPGGVIALITSKGTMDKKDESTRKYIAQRADLLGAIRLPNDAFKSNAGTTVTTDILFLQKCDSVMDIMPDWVHLDTDENGITMNKYFVDNPNMILGNMEMISSQFGGYVSACVPYEDENIEDLLNTAIENIHAEITEYELEELEEEDNSIEADLTVVNFSYTIKDNKVYYRENSRMFPQNLSVTAENRVKSLIELRDCVRELINLQLDDYSDDVIKVQQQKLNELYDSFINKYGLINSRANASVFSQDNSYFLLCSLEILDENGNLLRKADMFSKRTIKAYREVKKIENSNDALIASIGEKARVDLDYMSEISHKTKEELIKDLEGVIFKIPREDKYVTADEYLSGNILEKLKEAEYANEVEPIYNINIKYLKEAKPKPLSASEINVRIGTTWIPKEDYEDFMYELFGTAYYLQDKIKINYSSIRDEWNIENKSRDNANEKVRMTYGTKRINGYHILEETLNLKDVKVYDYIEDINGKKKQVLNGKETAIAQAKQEQIRQAFQEWIWKDPDRRNRLEKKYNEIFNAIRPREYDGSHIRFDGMNPEITLRKHQVDAIARILYGGNTLLAHEVGAGKTFEMVAAAMESKRLGLCNKSLFVVPNHIIEQFASEFLQLYPSANILVATKKDFETGNRKKFCSRIATGEYDAVIMGHSQFEKIPMSIERQIKLFEAELQEIMKGIEYAQEVGASFSVKKLMKTKKEIEMKLTKLNSTERKDSNVVTFEQLGVDRLFVDEAHYYKNLYLYSKMNNVSGISQTEAQKSSDLYMKCKYMDEITDGRGIIFATGTPVSNSMVELYTMQRYLQSHTLKKLKLMNFDAWASTFGETVTSLELSPEGTGYRAKTRFAKFYNLPELISIFKEVADIQTSEMLKLPVPKANYENIVIKPSEIQEKMVKELSKRAEKIRNGDVDPHDDNMLKITSDGKKLALDPRLINELLPDNENGKVAICANKVYEFYKKYDDIKGTQLVFCDMSTPKSDGTFSVYNDLKSKLIAKGIPENEISFIHDANSEEKKKDLFAKVRKGQVRVLIGSTQKMGAGTNCQDRLIALHDLDCPWRPADLKQRSGRIIRQGNQNKEVYIFRYVTEKTFDAYLYQLIENKQKFISQIMTSKVPLRTASDVDEAVLSYSEIKALASGNPLILEKTELDTKVSKLKLLKQSYLSQKYELEDKIRTMYPNNIKLEENTINDISDDLMIFNNNKNGDFNSIEFNGTIYTDRKKAGEALLEIIKDNPTIDSEKIIGSYLGFTVSLGYNFLDNHFYLNLENKHSYTVNLGSDSTGNIIRIDNELGRIANYLENHKNKLNTLKQQYEIAKQEVEKPFSQEEELKEAIEKLKKVDIALNINEKVPEVIEQDGGDRPSQPYKREYAR